MIIIILSAFAVYIIAAPHSTRNAAGDAYAVIGAEEKPAEAPVLGWK